MKPDLFEERLAIISAVETHQKTALQTSIILLRHIDLNALVQATIKLPTHDFVPYLLIVQYCLLFCEIGIHQHPWTRLCESTTAES